jgi:hypothetical protein
VRYIADFSPIDRQKNPPIIAPKRGENKIISSKKSPFHDVHIFNSNCSSITEKADQDC